MTQELTNMTVSNISINKQLDQFMLTVKEPSIFDPNGSEHTIMLWSKDAKSKAVDPAQVEQTQALLRKVFNDDTIVFKDPSAGFDDPNHFGAWLNKHPNAPISVVYVTDAGQYSLSNDSGSRVTGDSKWLETYDINKDGEYTQEYRVPVIDAVPDKMRTEIINASGPNVKASRSGYTTLAHTGIIKDVVFTSANGMNETTTDYNKETLRTAILQQLNIDASAAPLAQQIAQLPKDYAFVKLIDILGGYQATSLPNSSPARNSVPGILNVANRETMRLYLVNPVTGYVYQSSQLKAQNRGQHFNLTFEFLANEFSASDLSAFIQDATSKGLNVQDVTKKLIETGMYDPESRSFKYDTPQKALDTLRTLLVGRLANIESFLTSDGIGGKTDPSKIGARVMSFGDEEPIPTFNGHSSSEQPEIVLPDNMETEPVQKTPVIEAPTATQPVQAAPQPAPAVETPKDAVVNPFAQSPEANSTPEPTLFNTPDEPKTTESSDDGVYNPFAQ